MMIWLAFHEMHNFFKNSTDLDVWNKNQWYLEQILSK